MTLVVGKGKDVVLGREFMQYVYTMVDYEEKSVTFRVATAMQDYVIIIPSVTNLEIGYIIGGVFLIVILGFIIFVGRICCKKCAKKSKEVDNDKKTANDTSLDRNDSLISIKFDKHPDISLDSGHFVQPETPYVRTEQSSYVTQSIENPYLTINSEVSPMEMKDSMSMAN